MTSKFAMITFMDGGAPGAPDNALPGAPVFPSQGLPGAPAYPSQGLPGAPVYPIHLPVYPFDPTAPDNSLPGGTPRPDQGLPVPGKKYIVKWLACVGLILVPDNSLPTVPATPGNELPPTPAPK